jgi:lipid-A-disaccharide synthase
MKHLKTYEDKKESVDAVFVGHPGVDELRPTAIAPKNDKIKIALLPGSRKQEIQKLIPIMSELVKEVNLSKHSVDFKVLIAKNLELDFVKKLFGNFANVEYETSGEIGKVNDCNFAVVAIGTATLEMAIQAEPMIVIYKVSKLSGLIFDIFVKYKGFIGMVNIIHGKEVCKELIQSKLTKKTLYDETMKLIKDESYRVNQRSILLQTRNLLIKSNASEFTAKEILNVIGRKTKTQ